MNEPETPSALSMPYIVLVQAAGFALGFVLGIFATSPLWMPNIAVSEVWVRAVIGGFNGAATFLRIARWRDAPLPKEISLFCILFLLATGIPWFRTPFGGYLPLGTAYVNPGFGAARVLAAHLLIATCLTIIAVILVNTVGYLRTRLRLLGRRP
jgi:hypothetical protein